jgi:hypothetical protein
VYRKKYNFELTCPDRSLPIGLQHRLGLLQERPCRRCPGITSRLGFKLGLKERPTLWQQRSEDRRKHRQTGSDPIEGAPGVRVVGYESQVDDGRDEVADSVTLLQETRDETPGVGGDIFERGGCGQTLSGWNSTHVNMLVGLRKGFLH